nr:MAG TPA: ParB protein [Caudoviricetes sp.]
MRKKETAERTPVRVAVKSLPTIRIDELIPYANNAKIHGPDQIEQLRRSLRQFGFVSPVLIDEKKT